MKTFVNRKWSVVLLLTVAGWLAGCAPVAHVEKDESTDFSRYKTYAWIDTKEEGKGRVNDLMESRVKEAVSQELQRTAGWKETRQNPDVLLSYDVLVERSLKRESDPVYSRPFIRTLYNPYTRRFFNVYYPSQFVGYDNYEVPVKEGTVTVTMTDAQTDKTVWQGWTTGELDKARPTTREIQTSIKAIFRKFDVAKS